MSTIESGLSGGVAIVTGGSRGIGRAIVERLAGDGMEVIFTYLGNDDAANEVVAANEGKTISAKKVDVRDSEACRELAQEIFDRTERIDVLVNNAGIIRDNQLVAFEDADVSEVLATNVEGTFNMARAVLPWMMMKRSGSIINMSSVSGEKGGRGQTNYAASKGAVNSMTKALAVEVSKRKIRVNAVAPGVIETEMSEAVREMAGDKVKSEILLKRYGQPEDIANAVWFLASDLANYVTGQILHVDGGFKMA